MAIINADQIRQLGDFATQDKWDMEFIKLPQGFPISSQDLLIRVETSDLPKTSGQSGQIQLRGNAPINQPGLYVPNQSTTITFVEGTPRPVLKAMWWWATQCYDPKTGKGRPKAEIEATLKITLCDRQFNANASFILYGCYLEDGDAGGSLLGNSADFFKPTMTLKWDYYELVFNK